MTQFKIGQTVQRVESAYTHAHIMQMLRQKHPGKEVRIQYRAGGEVAYLVGEKTK